MKDRSIVVNLKFKSNKDNKIKLMNQILHFLTSYNDNHSNGITYLQVDISTIDPNDKVGIDLGEFKSDMGILVAFCNKCNIPYPFDKPNEHKCLEQDVLDYKEQQATAKSIDNAYQSEKNDV